ncbi:hypothetical protein BGZ97_010567 [Linnemannia gamsii]|uniref:RING-type domain-containing protein n=1 Tax=Linnemannia gamsii TaxID=64522 RepID=A0A9P6R5D5_9FUNG|nr:hypothetical protein BGZ97_010567 [Linnemannia gamsii]
MDVAGVDGSGIGNGVGVGAGVGVGSNGIRLSMSTQIQRSSIGRDVASPTTLAGLGGSCNINNNGVSSGSSAIGMNENTTCTGHAKSTAGGCGVGGQWKPNTLSSSSFSSSSSSATSPLSKKYESVSKGIGHSEGLAMPIVYLGNPTQQQQHQPRLGALRGSESQQQFGRQLQSVSSATDTVTDMTTARTFLQQNRGNINTSININNSTEMDTFSELHSGVIMAYPNNLSSSSSHPVNTTLNRSGFIGLNDFVRSLFSQSLVSRLYSHRPRFSSVSIGSSWSAMSLICNDQLYSWLTVQAFLFLSQIVSTCNILQRQTTMMISSSRANVMDQRTRIIFMISMVWTVIGVGFLGSDSSDSQDPCATTNDPIHSLAFKIIVFHATIFGFYFLPCSSLLLTRVFPNSISPGMTRTATKPMIDKLGSTPMVEGMFGGDAEEATCAICLGDYKPDETIRFLPCQHHFHLECVDQWLATDKSCPLCKHDIDKPLDIHNNRRSATPHTCNNNNTSEDETHHNHNSEGTSHSSGGSSGGNNVVGMDGFQVIIV